MTAKSYIKIAVVMICLVPLSVHSQPYGFLDMITNETIILNEGGVIRGGKAVSAFKSKLAGSGLNENSYEMKFDIEVNTTLTYEIGEVPLSSDTYSVMFVKNKHAATSHMELLVIYKKSNSGMDAARIDAMRTKWMELCNTHQVGELVKQLYTTDAWYYNRGRLLQGTEALAKEYSYMNSPTYSLKLTPKHVVFVSEKIAFEIGQCSGSYPLPYMLLWEKQSTGDWQVRMDSNF